jgi:hypothetical protein
MNRLDLSMTGRLKMTTIGKTLPFGKFVIVLAWERPKKATALRDSHGPGLINE